MARRDENFTKRLFSELESWNVCLRNSQFAKEMAKDLPEIS